MKKKIIIHTGTEKTGSTSIQHFMFENRALFEQHGIYIPLSGVESNHHYWIAKALDFKWEGNSLDADHENQALLELRNEIFQADQPIVLLSSEHFDIQLNLNNTQKTREFFSDYELEIICFLRNQIDYSQSLYMEGLKWSVVLEYSDFLRLQVNGNRLDYSNKFQLWSTAADKVTFLDYDSERTNLIESFLDSIDPQLSTKLLLNEIEIHDKNVTPSVNILEFFRLLNTGVEDGKRRHFFQSYFERIAQSVPVAAKKEYIKMPESMWSIFQPLDKSNRELASALGYDENSFLGGSLRTRFDNINEIGSVPDAYFVVDHLLSTQKMNNQSNEGEVTDIKDPDT